MSSFQSYALQYVLSDDCNRMDSAVSKAAAEIEESRGSSTIILKWAESIRIWMPTTNNEEDGESKGDILARVKALGFLSQTLELLNRDTLRQDQVTMLVSFFEAMFAADHKIGIAPAARALRCLVGLKAFKPDLGCDIIDQVAKLGEDFQSQGPSTRLEVYELIQMLVQDDVVSNVLRSRLDSTTSFIRDILLMCRNERDPRNLMIWFDIIKKLLHDYSQELELVEMMFATFSVYFPISLKASSTPIGITAENLKLSLRNCFSAHQCVAEHALPFLIQKLDQGDAITISAKVDILLTLEACLTQYGDVYHSIVPSIGKMWNSLKYEVKNGELEDSIDKTLSVLRTLSSRLENDILRDFAQIVLRDCLDDLANPTYASQAGRLLQGVYCSSPAAYSVVVQTLIPHISLHLRKLKSSTHAIQIVEIANSVLATRNDLFTKTKLSNAPNESLFASLVALFDEVYSPLWETTVASSIKTDKEAAILVLIAKGVALLAGQENGNNDHLSRKLFLSEKICKKGILLLSHTILNPLWNSGTASQNMAEVEDEVVIALREISTICPAGFVSLIEQSKGVFSSSLELKQMKLLAARLAFIGCSKFPRGFNALHNVVCLVGAFLHELQHTLYSSQRGPTTALLAGAIHCCFLNFSAVLRELPKKGLPALQGDWESTGRFLFPNLPRIDEGWPGEWMTVDTSAMPIEDTELNFQKLFLIIVRQLYRSVTKVFIEGQTYPLLIIPEVKSQGALLRQISTLATSVCRILSPGSQKNLMLFAEGLSLFRSSDKYHNTTLGQWIVSLEQMLPVSEECSGLLMLVSGVIQGLHKSCFGFLSDFGNGKKLLRQLFEQACLPDIAVRNMLLTVANKYPRSHPSWPLFVQMACEGLQCALSENTEPHKARAHFEMALNFAAGACPNYDSHLGTLAGHLAEVPSRSELGTSSWSQFSVLVNLKSALSPDNHAVSKRLWKQWVYTKIAKPMMEKSFLLQEACVTQSYSCATLALVAYIPFEVYADDVEKLVLLAIPAMSNCRANSDFEPTIQFFFQLLNRHPEILKHRVNSLIKEAMFVLSTNGGYGEKMDIKDAGGSAKEGYPLYRKLVLDLIGRLPEKLDERYLIPYARRLCRDLSFSCGDPVREVRQAAMKARLNWIAIS